MSYIDAKCINSAKTIHIYNDVCRRRRGQRGRRVWGRVISPVEDLRSTLTRGE